MGCPEEIRHKVLGYNLMIDLKQRRVGLITGGLGQCGSYLAELLLEKDYDVYILYRRTTSPHFENIKGILDHPRLHLVQGDITDSGFIFSCLSSVKPDEIYNLAAQSFVKSSFDIPIHTFDVDTIGVLNILEWVRQQSSSTKMYQACYDKNTNILTEDGIKTVEEVKIGQEVFTINEETGTIEKKRIRNIVKYKYKGNMIKINSRRINQLLTPNHRILLQDDNKKIISCEAQNLKDILDKFGSSHSLPCGKLVGIINNNYIFNSLDKENHYKNLINEMEIHDFLWLCGLYIGDGWVKKRSSYITISRKEREKYKDNKTGRYLKTNLPKSTEKYSKYSSFIEFAIPKNDKARNKLLELLNRNNFNYIEKDDTVSFSCQKLADYFINNIGTKFDNKIIPSEFFKYDSSLLVSLLYGMLYSDGYFDGNIKTYSTSNKKLAEQFVLLCTLCGFFAKISKKPWNKNNKNNKINGREIIQKKDAYYIGINFKTINKIYRKHISESYYEDDVWCLEIEDNHNFLVIKDGRPFFSGNCTSEQFGKSVSIECDVQGSNVRFDGSLDRIKHLKQYDNYFYQDEDTPFIPQSPYAIAKLAAHHLCRLYREAYGLYIAANITFNMESPRRGKEFVTRKITDYIGRLINSNNRAVFPKLQLGNIYSSRDWGAARDYMEAAYLAMQQETSDDYVICTGETHTVEEFLEEAFSHVGLNWKDYVEISKEHMRPAEVDYLNGCSDKSRVKLGWSPKTTFKDLVKEMVEASIKEHING